MYYNYYVIMYIVQICIYLCILVQIATYVYSYYILYFFILQKTTQTHAQILTLIYANSNASTQCTLSTRWSSNANTSVVLHLKVVATL